MKLTWTFAIITTLSIGQSALAHQGKTLVAFAAPAVPQFSRFQPSTDAKASQVRGANLSSPTNASAAPKNHRNSEKDESRFIMGGPDVVPM